MKATLSSHFFPTKLPSLPKTPPLPLSPPPLRNIRCAVSITSPESQFPQKITTTTTTADDSIKAFWDYQFLFVSQRSETVEPITLRVVEGSIPSDFPHGTYYLTGPGIFTDDYGSTVHPLDGHGYLRAFEINGSKNEVNFSAKYIKTEAQSEECDPETGKWRFTHRGPFSVLRAGKKVGNVKVMKNVANTSVVKWGGRLLCLWEGGVPYEIESKTLDTIGRFDVIDGEDCLGKNGVNGGVGQDIPHGSIWDVAAQFLKPILHGVYNMPPKRLLSHYKIDPHRERLLLISCNAEDMLLPQSTFTFYEFDSNFKLVTKETFNLPEHMMIHDWAFTDSHYILFGNRIKLDIPGSMLALSGMSPMISALSVDSSKHTSPIYLLPRFRDEVIESRDWKVPIEAPEQMWILHVANSFEQRDISGNLEIHVHATACSYQWFHFSKMFGYDWKMGQLDPAFMNAKEGEEHTLPQLVKVSMKFDKIGKHQNCSVESLNMLSRPSDFAVISPMVSSEENTYIYAATSSGSSQTLPHFPFDTVSKHNVFDKSFSTWSVGSRRFIGEPIFVPTEGENEDDGYILVVEYAVSIQRCYLVILDPKRIGEDDAVVAKLEVPKNLNFPLGFHGFWAGSD
ncbi:9-cis-beta-carotene 9',10'-cleaving dioxygenase [Ranunculus cassubicifolius]